MSTEVAATTPNELDFSQTLLGLVDTELKQMQGNVATASTAAVVEPVAKVADDSLDTATEDKADGVAVDGTDANEPAGATDGTVDVPAEAEVSDSHGGELLPDQLSHYLQVLVDMGADVDELNEAQARAIVMKRLQAPAQSPTAPVAAPVVPVVAAPVAVPEVKPTEAEKPSAKEARLKKIIRDQELESLVVFEGGRAVPKEQTPSGLDAAKKINDYLAEGHKRLTSFTEDPVEFLLPGMQGQNLEDRIQRMVADQLAKQAELTNQEATRQAAVLAAQAEQGLVGKFSTDHESELFKLTADGKRKVVLGEDGNDVFAMTDFGKRVRAGFEDLLELAPHQPTSVLLDRAYKIAKQTVTTEPVVAPEEKKKKFLANRGGVAVPRMASQSPASADEIASGGGSLRDVILHTASNADNPVLAELRS